jgi:hypothetical protein
MGKMMKYLFFLIAGLSLCACAPMNTEFSCHSTAGDRCLSIEAVNTMTEVGDDAVQQMHKYPSHKTQTMWVAPWVDRQGASHQAEHVLAMNIKVGDASCGLN